MKVVEFLEAFTRTETRVRPIVMVYDEDNKLLMWNETIKMIKEKYGYCDVVRFTAIDEDYIQIFIKMD